MDIGIWYPSEGAVPASPNTPFGQALAIGAEPAGSALPVVILSHGNGGWMGSHADTALALADAGYVAIGLTHSDDNSKNENVAPSVWMFSRPRELIASIDEVQQHWPDARHMSEDQIGVFGFSAGGYTALVAAGAVPDIDLAVQHCKVQPLEYLCVIGVVDELADNLQSGALTEFAGDSRIKAVSVAAPAFGFTFNAKSLQAVTVPVQIWSGALDERVPHDSNGGVISSALPGLNEVEIVAGAGHFSYLTPCDPAMQAANAGLWERICVDATGFDRLAFHDTFNARVVEFFDKAMVP
ncbi:hypothetical protein IMCC3135_05590 [Granulosicoccus antarcticus IMCC3135]|uniref:Dienelactone hydrolase domain-containing protein n=2 Tax=Granulosicoccus TaxID=437504 RepID=A0A2Z2NR67_9GAMM|nr:hypothetical protein IMCC3135_05590 [Granulosicoccus antarcticus IMCC3135]